MKIEITVTFEAEIGEQAAGVEAEPVSTEFDYSTIQLFDRNSNLIQAKITGHETVAVEQLAD